MKRMISLILAAVCLLGCLSGCKKEQTVVTDLAPTYSSGAMGRYVERSIPLPEGKYVQDMVMLTDGRLRVSLTMEDGSGIVCTTGPDRTSWEETWQVPGDILASGRVTGLTLSPDGTVFCPTWRDEDGSYDYHFWVINPNKTFHEIPITCPDVDYSLGYMTAGSDFTDSGRLIVAFQNAAICQVDLVTGAVGENIQDQKVIMKMGCAGEDTYMAGWDSMSAHLDGETGPLENAMGKQLSDALKANEGNEPKFTYWRNAEGYLFFTTQEGLFSYIPGGSLTEELVSGGHSTLGDPKFLPVALTGGEDDTFYVLGYRSAGENMLLCYSYDEEVPTVSDTHLKIYSLLQDEDLPQMVSQYQVAHPEVTVDLEIGITGEDGVTLADAIRTLNTEILAGSGPDLICLDGFNLDSYVEKGMLADLRDTLDQAEPTLSQITRCYAQEDGQIFAVPTSFVIPAMYGPSGTVSQIHNWDSLVTAVEQLKAEKSTRLGVLAAFIPVDTANKFYDVCSTAWIRPDGTIDEAGLAGFYDGVRRVWNLDSEFQALWADRLDEEPYWPMGEYIGLMSSSSVANNGYLIGFGGLNGMLPWADTLCARDEVPDYVTAPLSLYDSGVFIPRNIMGILSGSKHPQAAADFLKFMLSEGVQAKDLTYSFPVNQAVFDKETSEDRVVELYLSTEDADGNNVSYQAQWPDARDRENLRAWVANLTTPASTDRTIRQIVLEQMYDCLTGAITPEEAAHAAMQSLDLYLAE